MSRFDRGGDRLETHDHSPTRRRTLAGAGAAATALLAGCSTVARLLGGGRPDVVVYNRTEGKLTVTVEVTKADAEKRVLSRTVDLASSEGKRFDDVYDGTARYRFRIETGDGRSRTHEWELPSTDHFLEVRVNDDGIDFRHRSP